MDKNNELKAPESEMSKHMRHMRVRNIRPFLGGDTIAEGVIFAAKVHKKEKEMDQMTALEACSKIEEAITGLHEETRNSGWDWSYTESLSDEGHLANHKESLEKTRAHFALEGSSSMWFVSTNGTDAILAMCGNSPTAEARARYISWVNPQNLQLLIARLRYLEGVDKA